MNELKQIGHIGSILVQLDCSDAAHPALILNDIPQAEHLAQLLSPEPLVIDWLGENFPDCVVLSLAYTPDVDRLIVDLIDTLGSVRFAIPGLVQLSMLNKNGDDDAAR